MGYLSIRTIFVGLKRKLAATPDGSARAWDPGLNEVREAAQAEPMGKRPPAGASIPTLSQIHLLFLSPAFELKELKKFKNKKAQPRLDFLGAY